MPTNNELDCELRYMRSDIEELFKMHHALMDRVEDLEDDVAGLRHQ